MATSDHTVALTKHSPEPYRQILGINFYVGSVAGLMQRTLRGGLIVVPSAPVLVNLPNDTAHRTAVEGSDFAITDSGFLVLLWKLFKRETLPRISGLRYLRHLLLMPEFKQPGATFWVMPTAHDAEGNRRWLASEGFTLNEADIYLAPLYARQGPLEDKALLAAIRARRPRFIMLNLGGGVQERLGWYLRKELEAESEERAASSQDYAPLSVPRSPLPAPVSQLSTPRSPLPTSSDLRSAISHPSASIARKGESQSVSGSQLSALSFQLSVPAIICTGAAIAFLSGRQTNIPPWADHLFLGWLMRSLSEPTKFIPRYWHALRLTPLLWKHGERSVAEKNS